jgi:hypothetical protein
VRRNEVEGVLAHSPVVLHASGDATCRRRALLVFHHPFAYAA